MPSILMIVARDRLDLYERLQKEFERDRAIAVVLDRRFAQRRRSARPVTEEQRNGDRRRRDVGDNLRHLGWATARAT